MDNIGRDERCREEEQAEDEVPDEAVTLSARDPGWPESDCAQRRTQDPPEQGHDRFLSAFVQALLRDAESRVGKRRSCRTPALHRSLDLVMRGAAIAQALRVPKQLAGQRESR
jgi:hypothetical protein